MARTALKHFMSWTYIQRTGEMLAPDGKLLAVGYSGLGIAKNDPAAEMLKDQGPIPTGKYTILPPADSPTHGPYAMHLQPDPDNQMWGRNFFMMHGDSIKALGTASDGCIIMPRVAREAIWQSGDHELQVLSGLDPTTPSDLDAGDL